MIGSRKHDRERTAREVWVRAMRIAEAAGAISPREDPRLARRVLQVCRGALADVFEALWAREPAAAQPALEEAAAVLEWWWDSERERWEQERGERCPPGSGVAHVLLAPSLAELTVANSHDDAVDLGEMTEAAQTPSQRMLLALAVALRGGEAGRQVTLDELLELDPSDLRYALEGIAVDHSLWPVRRDLRWLHAALALRGHSEHGG
jgi:hypothetical protein